LPLEFGFFDGAAALVTHRHEVNSLSTVTPSKKYNNESEMKRLREAGSGGKKDILEKGGSLNTIQRKN